MDLYAQLIEYLKSYGEVLTEHVGSKDYSAWGESVISDRDIHDRDMEWLVSSDPVVAEVTTPSLGVGYEIARAVEMKKKVLCLYRPQEGKRLSGMINGCSDVTVVEYRTLEDARGAIDRFIKYKN